MEFHLPVGVKIPMVFRTVDEYMRIFMGYIRNELYSDIR